MRSPEPYIASPANPRVKLWARLLERKHRDREGRFLLEGVHLVKEALEADWPLEVVAYEPGTSAADELEAFAEAKSGAAGRAALPAPDRTSALADSGPDGLRRPGNPGISRTAWIPVSPEVIARCSGTETPQPVFAVAAKRPVDAGALLNAGGGSGLVVALDGVQDPGNVGTIVRGASASGVAAVVFGKGTADLYNPKTLRATMGAAFHIPVCEGDLRELLPAATRHGAIVAGTSLREGAISCYDYDFRRRVWLVFGNEGAGVSPDVDALVRDRLVIPMSGRAESLNVAMAATILMFEAQRQRAVNPK